jgi:hypothetical protein
MTVRGCCLAASLTSSCDRGSPIGYRRHLLLTRTQQVLHMAGQCSLLPAACGARFAVS